MNSKRDSNNNQHADELDLELKTLRLGYEIRLLKSNDWLMYLRMSKSRKMDKWFEEWQYIGDLFNQPKENVLNVSINFY